MDHLEQSTTDGSPPPRRKLQVARETLRQLGARTLRQVAGGTGYSAEPCTWAGCVYTVDWGQTCEPSTHEYSCWWTCEGSCESEPGCTCDCTVTCTC
ncbi:MAG: hypothetical protein KY467_02830 [Gemmatimonadetes bacterium]|nr:hypothetical protein [Gemmatimonadota bacterium]